MFERASVGHSFPRFNQIHLAEYTKIRFRTECFACGSGRIIRSRAKLLEIEIMRDNAWLVEISHARLD